MGRAPVLLGKPLQRHCSIQSLWNSIVEDGRLTAKWHLEDTLLPTTSWPATGEAAILGLIQDR